MIKKKLVLRRFKCIGADNDCPKHGFEVIKAKNVDIDRHSMLTDWDLDRFHKDKVKIIIAK